MRTVAMSVWIFLNLLCFSMCGYMYLIWSRYWFHTEKQRLFTKPKIYQERDQQIDTDIYALYPVKYSQLNVTSTEETFKKVPRSAILRQLDKVVSGNPAVNVITNIDGSPRFPNVQNPVLEFDSEKYKCTGYSVECENKTKQFKDLLIKEIHRILMSDSNVFKSGLESMNSYNVHFDGIKLKHVPKAGELACLLKNIGVRTVRRTDKPFSNNTFKNILPSDSIFGGKYFNTCAIVTSAGGLLGSRLGSFIDSHDMVLRFNTAPTDGYTDDVGSKTTIRIVNSQVVSNNEFISSPLYKNVTLLAWDTSNYTSTLTEWYNSPEHNVFNNYKRFMQMNPKADFHLLHPNVIWSLWNILQMYSPYRLRRNPPSSGFLGLWLSMHTCLNIDMIEYIPSVRVSSNCHYWSASTDGRLCTLGAWHPLAQEKRFAMWLADLNDTSKDYDVFQRGVLHIHGLKNYITC